MYRNLPSVHAMRNDLTLYLENNLHIRAKALKTTLELLDCVQRRWIKLTGNADQHRCNVIITEDEAPRPVRTIVPFDFLCCMILEVIRFILTKKIL